MSDYDYEREAEGVPPPDYSDKPTVILEWAYGDGVYGVQTQGFKLPTGVRVVARDYSEGEIHTDGQFYEDVILTDSLGT